MVDVVLRPIDDETLEALLRVAVTDAVPEDVMPAVPGPPGWTNERRRAFRDFHLARRPGLDGAHRELSLAIVAAGTIVGVARLKAMEHGCYEIGLWIGRTQRGRGIGSATIGALRTLAASLGATELRADTTTTNRAALAVLRRHGANLATDAVGTVKAELAVSEVHSAGKEDPS